MHRRVAKRAASDTAFTFIVNNLFPFVFVCSSSVRFHLSQAHVAVVALLPNIPVQVEEPPVVGAQQAYRVRLRRGVGLKPGIFPQQILHIIAQ